MYDRYASYSPDDDDDDALPGRSASNSAPGNAADLYRGRLFQLKNVGMFSKWFQAQTALLSAPAASARPPRAGRLLSSASEFWRALADACGHAVKLLWHGRALPPVG